MTDGERERERRKKMKAREKANEADWLNMQRNVKEEDFIQFSEEGEIGDRQEEIGGERGRNLILVLLAACRDQKAAFPHLFVKLCNFEEQKI